MAREKISVRQQQFGFPDEDLKTSLHDEIVLWLKRNELDLTKKLLGWSDFLDIKVVEAIEASLKKSLKELEGVLETELKENSESLKEKSIFGKDRVLELIKIQTQHLEFIKTWAGLGAPPASKIQIESQIEVPIKRERYKSMDIIGYADIVYSVRTATPRVFPLPKDEAGKFQCKKEFNPASQLRWCIDWSEVRRIGFDAKSAIPSFGELIRQLNTYRAFCSWPFYVVSPDARFENEISNEGFGFIKYPEGVITHPKYKNKQS